MRIAASAATNSSDCGGFCLALRFIVVRRGIS
jgi:hypothetical protein